MLDALIGDGCFDDLRRYRDNLGFIHSQYHLDLNFIHSRKRSNPVAMDSDRFEVEDDEARSSPQLQKDSEASSCPQLQTSSCPRLQASSHGQLKPVALDSYVGVDLGVEKIGRNNKCVVASLESQKQKQPQTVPAFDDDCPECGKIHPDMTCEFCRPFDWESRVGLITGSLDPGRVIELDLERIEAANHHLHARPPGDYGGRDRRNVRLLHHDHPCMDESRELQAAYSGAQDEGVESAEHQEGPMSAVRNDSLLV